MTTKTIFWPVRFYTVCPTRSTFKMASLRVVFPLTFKVLPKVFFVFFFRSSKLKANANALGVLFYPLQSLQFFFFVFLYFFPWKVFGLVSRLLIFFPPLGSVREYQLYPPLESSLLHQPRAEVAAATEIFGWFLLGTCWKEPPEASTDKK